MYGDSISVETHLQKVDGADLQINSAGVYDGSRAVCTSTGIYTTKMYVNKKISSNSATCKQKDNGIVSLNGSSGNNFNIIY